MRYQTIIITVLTALMITGSLTAQQANREIRVQTTERQSLHPFVVSEPARPRVILALSGGGARGIAHCGVLSVLDSANIRVDGIAGVSIGALVGSLYAGGLSADEIGQMLGRFDWNGMIFDRPVRENLALGRKDEHSRHLLTLRLGDELKPVIPGAISTGQLLFKNLFSLTLDLPHNAEQKWDKLRTPLAILATDLNSGKGIVSTEGDRATAIRASMAVPLLFDPVQLDTLMLMDGGVTYNIPVEIAQQMGGDIVIAVDATSPLSSFPTTYQAWQMADQVTTIFEQEIDNASRAKADIVITPKLDDISSLDRHRVSDVVRQGAYAMRQQLPALLERLAPVSLPDDADILNVHEIVFNPDSVLVPVLTPPASDWANVSMREVRNYLREFYYTGIIQSAFAEYENSTGKLTIVCKYHPILNGVTFTGVSEIQNETRFRGLFAPLQKKRINTQKLDFTFEQLLRAYRQLGYPLAQIVKTEYDSITNRLAIHIDEGRLGEIQFRGVERVSRSLLAREVPIRKGETIQRDQVTKGMENLFATDLFKSVYPMFEQPDGAGSPWNIVFLMTEQPVPLIRVGLAYHTEQRTRGSIEISYPTTAYYWEKASYYGSVGLTDQEQQFKLSADNFLGLPVIYDISLHYRRRDRSLYDQYTHRSLQTYTHIAFGGELNLGIQPWKWGQMTVIGRWEQHQTSYPKNLGDYFLSSVGGRIALDTQDRSTYPEDGIKFVTSFESAPKYFGSELDMWKYIIEWEGFATPVPRHTTALRFFGRLSDEKAPFDERFRWGGTINQPGFRLDELIGAMQIGGGVEYRFDLISRILADSYAGGRFDVMGNWENLSAQIERSHWARIFSAYFALDTVLGPMHLQYSHLYPSDGMEPADLLFLQMGYRF